MTAIGLSCEYMSWAFKLTARHTVLKGHVQSCPVLENSLGEVESRPSHQVPALYRILMICSSLFQEPLWLDDVNFERVGELMSFDDVELTPSLARRGCSPCGTPRSVRRE